MTLINYWPIGIEQIPKPEDPGKFDKNKIEKHHLTDKKINDDDFNKLLAERSLDKINPRKFDINNLIRELLNVMPNDMLDKTKCSVTVKNVYNYIINNYTSFNNFQKAELNISWNDTLQQNYLTLDELKKHLLSESVPSIVYCYFDHICGINSHYFIMLVNSYDTFYLLQSAVFEFSLAQWTLHFSNEDQAIINNMTLLNLFDNDIEDTTQKGNFDKVQYETLMRIMSNIPANHERSTEEFLNEIEKLEGSWVLH